MYVILENVEIYNPLPPRCESVNSKVVDMKSETSLLFHSFSPSSFLSQFRNITATTTLTTFIITITTTTITNATLNKKNKEMY